MARSCVFIPEQSWRRRRRWNGVVSSRDLGAAARGRGSRRAGDGQRRMRNGDGGVRGGGGGTEWRVDVGGGGGGTGRRRWGPWAVAVGGGVCSRNSFRVSRMHDV
jgi:hypothetical protein